MGLRADSLKALLWMLMGKIGTGITTLLVTLILARLLSPADFAIVEILIVFIIVSNVFVDGGFSYAIIRENNVTQEDLSSIFYFNLSVSCLLYVILYLLSPYIASYFDEIKLINLSRVIFLVIILNSLVLIQYTVLKKELKFELISKSSILSMLFSGAISLFLAFMNFGVWAIVANMTFQPFFYMLFLWYYSSWRPSFIFKIKSIKKYFSFSIFLLIQGLIDAIITNIASLIVGKMYTKTDLGLYSQGKKLDRYLISPFVNVLEQITYPITAKIKDNEIKFFSVYKEIFRLIIFIFLPLTIFVIMNSEDIVIVLFGNKWIGAAIFLLISCVFDLFYPLQRLSENVIKLKGNSKMILYIDIIRQIIRIISLCIFAKISVLALALSFTLSGIIGGMMYILLAFKLIKYSFSDFIKDNKFSAISTCMAVLFQIIVLHYTDLSPVYSIGINLLIMLFVYLYSSHLFKNTSFIYIKSLIVKKLSSGLF